MNLFCVKVDKLIPKTSKEFLNTMRIVSTISPQPSEEQLNTLASRHHAMHSDDEYDSKSCSNCENQDDDDEDHLNQMEEANVQAENSCPDGSGDPSSNRLVNVACRSYKEVCIYGHHTSASSNNNSTTTSDQAQTADKVYSDTGRPHNSQYLKINPIFNNTFKNHLIGWDNYLIE